MVTSVMYLSHHAVYLKRIVLYVSCITIKLEEKKEQIFKKPKTKSSPLSACH